MSSLQVRRVRFDLAGDDIPFNWQPLRPELGMLCNMISFFAPGFEKFIVDATREAIPLMTDPKAIEEANLYLRQEAQHSAAHVRHIKALARRWPGIEKVNDQVIASYDRLAQTKSLDWRLAYTAIIEATFTPYFKVLLDHEDKMFEPGDERVASLFLWHFVEEIEHRSSALIVLNAVEDSFLFRLKTIPGVVKHMSEIVSIITTGFEKYIPYEEGGRYARLFPDGFSRRALLATRKFKRIQPRDAALYAGVPRREIVEMIVGLIRSQGPSHTPEFESLPPFADRWFKRFDENPKSAAQWYTVGVRKAS